MAGLFGNQNAAGPHKKGAIRSGGAMAKSIVVGGGQFGAVTGAFAARKTAKAGGLAVTRKLLVKGALTGAKTGMRANIPLAIGVGTATAVGSHILKRRAEDRSIQGKSKALLKVAKGKLGK